MDDILNLWDGLKETPGRILGISSNHYDSLDPALVRPGRIDITMKLDNVTRETIYQMFRHYYGQGAESLQQLTQKVTKSPDEFGPEIDLEILNKIADKKYSPAEITNIFVEFRDNSTGFLERLIH